MQKLKTKPNTGRRIFAGLIDYCIIYIFTLVLIFAFGEKNHDGEYLMNKLYLFIVLTSWAIFTIGFEISFGTTLGTSLVGLKAIPKNGQIRNLSFGESFIRHILDPLDMFFFGLIGIIAINTTEFNQRIGDLLAKTIVVRTKTLTKIEKD